MEPKLLCQVSEMVSFTPLEVLALIPKATTTQLCKFFDLIEQVKQPPVLDVDREPTKEKTEAVPGTSLLDQLRQLDDIRKGRGICSVVNRESEMTVSRLGRPLGKVVKTF